MAEAAVINLLANIAPFFREEVNLLSGVREEIEYIRDEFERMTAFLRVADAREESDPQLKVWVKQVRDVAYDAEDVLEKFKLHAFMAKDSVVSFVRSLASLRLKKFATKLFLMYKESIPGSSTFPRDIRDTMTDMISRATLKVRCC